MANDKILSKKILKKWWFWVIAIIILGSIGALLDSGSSETESNSAKGAKKSETVSFNERYDEVYDILSDEYEADSDTFGGTDEDTWQTNNEANPDQFPYNYRDINFDNTEVFYEVKVLGDTSDASIKYFNDTYTCSEVYGSSEGCIVAKVGDDVIYLIALYDKNDTTTDLQSLSTELADTLNSAE